MTRAWICVALPAGLLLASAAAAHPGHGAGGGGFDLPHLLAEPLHGVPLASLALATALGVALLRRSLGAARGRRRSRR